MSDMLSTLLEDVRPRGALFDRSFMRPPWSLRFDEQASLTLATLLQGDRWITGRGHGREIVSKRPHDGSDLVLGDHLGPTALTSTRTTIGAARRGGWLAPDPCRPQ